MMRVLHVTPVLFGDEGLVGGGERYPIELARAMSEFAPTRLLGFADRSSVYQDGALDSITIVPQTRLRGGDLNSLSVRLLPHIARCDVVHVHQWESVLSNACVVLARALGKRVFATDHGGSSRNYWRQWRLDRLLTGFLPVSTFGASFYPSLNRVDVIFGGVNHQAYSPPPPGSPRSGAVYVGRLLPHKGVDLLIESLPADVPLLVIGRAYDGNYRDRLHRLAVGKAVTFSEAATDDDVRAAYRTARVSVLPSVLQPVGAPAAPKAELLGLALIEAMACATPVIATRTGGMPEVVDDGNAGLVVPPGNVEALGRAVTTLVRMPADDWTVMSTAARARVEASFTWSAVAQRCLAAYARMGRLSRPVSSAT